MSDTRTLPKPASSPVAVPPAPMRGRTIRVDDETWDRAFERAKRDGVDISKVIRHYLREYGSSVQPDA